MKKLVYTRITKCATGELQMVLSVAVSTEQELNDHVETMNYVNARLDADKDVHMIEPVSHQWVITKANRRENNRRLGKNFFQRLFG